MEKIIVNPFTTNANQMKETVEGFNDVYVTVFKESMRLTSNKELSHEVAINVLKTVK